MIADAFFLDADGERHGLAGPITRLGRADDADIVLAALPVSRLHAQLDLVAEGYLLTDLDSRNGTFVNGERLVDEAVLLNHNDVVVLGGAERLVFQDPNTTPVAPRIGRLVGVWIDPETNDVWVDAAKVEPPLSARQLGLLTCLYEADGAIVSRAQLVDEVWADVAAAGVSDDALAAALKRVRARLADTGVGQYVEVVRNRGVRLHQPKG